MLKSLWNKSIKSLIFLVNFVYIQQTVGACFFLKQWGQYNVALWVSMASVGFKIFRFQNYYYHTYICFEQMEVKSSKALLELDTDI